MSPQKTLPLPLRAGSRGSTTSVASGGLLDEEYSILNYYTARILEKKIRILRVSILCFLAGVLTALPHHLLNA